MIATVTVLLVAAYLTVGFRGASRRNRQGLGYRVRWERLRGVLSERRDLPHWDNTSNNLHGAYSFVRWPIIAKDWERNSALRWALAHNIDIPMRFYGWHRIVTWPFMLGYERLQMIADHRAELPSLGYYAAVERLKDQMGRDETRREVERLLRETRP